MSNENPSDTDRERSAESLEADAAPPPAGEPMAREAPSRYETMIRREGNYVVCSSSPNLLLSLELGKTVTEHGRRKYPMRTIFLDGAFAGAPFYDNRRIHYSLDHHQGCVRPFTLATCEQAAVVLVQGIPLEREEWRIVVNGTDLDAALAAWLLLNHAELRRDGFKLLETTMPFVRTEGILDTHGFAGALLSGLPEEERRVHEEKLESLLPYTRILAGASADQSAAALGKLLERLDRLLLPDELLKEIAEYQELGRVPLGNGKIAIMCRSRRGIYEIEDFLMERYGGTIGILVHAREEGQYSIKLLDQFLGDDLERLYRRLNRRDPAAVGTRDNQNAWGGSPNLGGSPRETGSSLSPADILGTIADVYQNHVLSLFRRLSGR